VSPQMVLALGWCEPGESEGQDPRCLGGAVQNKGEQGGGGGRQKLGRGQGKGL
jgi:hypothetical protein